MKFFSKTSAPRTRKIRENKCTCKVCGKVWHYGKNEKMQQVGNAMQNAGKSAMCCSGCAPAALIQDKKITDFSRCPECGSHNVTCEAVEYEISQ